MNVQKLLPEQIDRHLEALIEVLQQTVAADGAVGFVMPLSREAASSFWLDSIKPALVSGERTVFVVLEGECLAGTGQLIVGMPNNQPHRVEISKLMVHPSFRRRGVARKIMTALEAEAIEMGRTLITLDTRTGDGAEPLYAALGYKTAGIIPRYAQNAVGGDFHATTYMYKQLGA